VLSSYLIALIIGPLASSEPIDVRGAELRTWAVPEKQHLTAFAQTAAAAVLPLLEDYFGLPYAFGKVDQLGIPDFEAGAMENACAITFREVALLLDPATAPLSVQKRVAEVITHELAHQWFGNLVTMVWWDDLWLNEAFATWMAYKIVDLWRPDWRIWMDFEGGRGAALALDALQSTHAIRAEIGNAEEAGESFDAITYEKGGAVLRMIEGYLGAERFRDGIRLYMKRHQFQNAVADDLWTALGEASGEPVVSLANEWIRKLGYPLVSASLREQTGSEPRLRLHQRRFFADPEAHEGGVPTTWLVPAVIRFADDEGAKIMRVLLTETEAEFVLPARGQVRYVLANAGATGFFRVAYDELTWNKLLPHVAAIDPVERIALLTDQWTLVRAGVAPIQPFLDLVFSLASDPDPFVIDEVVNRLSVIEHRHLAEGAPRLFGRGWRRLLRLRPAPSDGAPRVRATISAFVGPPCCVRWWGWRKSRPRSAKVFDASSRAMQLATRMPISRIWWLRLRHAPLTKLVSRCSSNVPARRRIRRRSVATSTLSPGSKTHCWCTRLSIAHWRRACPCRISRPTFRSCSPTARRGKRLSRSCAIGTPR